MSASRSTRARRPYRPGAALSAAAGLAAWLIAARPAGAHGFGQRYELPLPLELYLFGGAAVVALSFVVSLLFVRRPREQRQEPTELLAGPLRNLLHPLHLALKVAALALWALTIAAGFLGNSDPYRNIAPTMVWIVWWVGFAYISALAGNLWALINPWQTVFDGADWLWRRISGCGLSRGLAYPEALGAWPACALLLAFAWIELVYPYAADPRHIAALATAYLLFTVTGMLVFSRDRWIKNAELFSLYFALFSRLAPLEAKDGRLFLRPPGGGLVDRRPISLSETAFILMVLATVLYDGLLTTPAWGQLQSSLSVAVGGNAAPLYVKTLGLAAFCLIFLGAYLGVCAAMSALAAGRPSSLELAKNLGLTLIPIAIGYHVAHYLVYLLIEGQYIIPLLSDPFGWGWDLIKTAGYRVDISLVGARFAWYTALAAIVTGHIAAVYLAHVRAIEVFLSPRVAVTQIPLTALMVAYTFVGLSIAAEPIVESRQAPAAPSSITSNIEIPKDALLPDANGTALLPVGADGLAQVKLTYKALLSPFHDGTTMNASDLIYAYVFAYRWGRRRDGDRHYDPAIDAATEPMRRHLAALRVTGVDSASKSFRIGDVNFVRQLITVEVYLNVAPDDAEWNAAIAPPFSTLPWHLLALMEGAVERGWAAFSEAEAKRRGVAWLDLVRNEELGAKLASLASEYERAAFRPQALLSSVGSDEAQRRWAALSAFYRERHHFLVTNGPYRLRGWSADSVTLEAFRDLSYPLGVGSYDAYAIPRRGFITDFTWSGGKLSLSGEMEIIDKFQRSYRLLRAPLASLQAVVLNRTQPECRYVVADSSQHIVLAGAAPLLAGKFEIDFEGRLPPGEYTVSALIAVNGNVMNPDIRRIGLAVR